MFIAHGSFDTFKGHMHSVSTVLGISLDKISLARVGEWGSEKSVKNTKMWVKIIRQKHRIVSGGSSSEYWSRPCLIFHTLLHPNTKGGRRQQNISLTWYKGQLEQLITSTLWGKSLAFCCLGSEATRPSILQAATPQVQPPVKKKEQKYTYPDHLLGWSGSTCVCHLNVRRTK